MRFADGGYCLYDTRMLVLDLDDIILSATYLKLFHTSGSLPELGKRLDQGMSKLSYTAVAD
jgi:hypothetical protein